MQVNEFAKEVLSIFPSIHGKVLKGQPAVLKEGKITLSQMLLLELVHAKRECKMSDVSKILGVTKSAITGITDRLLKMGFLRRARLQTDRRIVKIRLTPKGINIANKLKNYKLKMIRRLFATISQKERAQYLHILKKIQKNIQKKGSRPHG
ncbi:MAG: MarR family transcriptional regulator [Candidatus Omnitrophota bacterium]|nr:MAG: MarR family transcriptional regulator [Candidatus Omnitrophota bacterium]